jgi:hypothetical protein
MPPDPDLLVDPGGNGGAHRGPPRRS